MEPFIKHTGITAPLERVNVDTDAIIFVWFGLLKPLGMSPAEELVTKTVYKPCQKTPGPTKSRRQICFLESRMH